MYQSFSLENSYIFVYIIRYKYYIMIAKRKALKYPQNWSEQRLKTCSRGGDAPKNVFFLL